MSLNVNAINTILIIQSEKETREMLAELFKDNDFKVLEAGDGIEGLAKAKGAKIDAVLTSLNMPRMDAIEFLKEKQSNKNLASVPVIIYDNINTTEDKNNVIKMGAKGFINKGTVSPDQIIQKVSRAMQQGDYLFQIDAYALDAQQFIDDYHLTKNFKCTNCGADLAIKLSINKDKNINAKIVCPVCGKVYL